MSKSQFKKLILAAFLAAISISLSTFFVPVGVSKVFPVQHLVNVVAGVLLGPWYAVLCAFVTSIVRVLLGMGTLLAFPGSMCGALMAAFLFKKSKKVWTAVVGEIIGTGIIGSLLAYPVAVFFMGKEVFAFAFVVPFLMSSIAGAVLGGVIVKRLSSFRFFSS